MGQTCSRHILQEDSPLAHVDSLVICSDIVGLGSHDPYHVPSETYFAKGEISSAAKSPALHSQVCPPQLSPESTSTAVPYTSLFESSSVLADQIVAKTDRQATFFPQVSYSSLVSRASYSSLLCTCLGPRDLYTGTFPSSNLSESTPCVPYFYPYYI